MNIVINPFSKKSVNGAIKQLQDYKNGLRKKLDTLCGRLAEIGMVIATDYYSAAQISIEVFDNLPSEEDYTNVFVKQESSEDGKIVYTVYAKGSQVCFIEFGAGVHFNSGGDPYHETRPEGVVGIGEYGLGLGKNDFWSYKNDEGMTITTYGTPEQPYMYLTAQEMRSRIEEIAREVFKDD